MKLLPNKGYLIAKEANLAMIDNADRLPAPNEKFHEVVAISENNPLCKVGDIVILNDVVKYFFDIVVAREEDVMGWVELDD